MLNQPHKYPIFFLPCRYYCVVSCHCLFRRAVLPDLGSFLGNLKYSPLSLSRINVYLEVKILSLFKHENLPTGNIILWKRGEIAPKEFLYFSIIFSICF